jgi:ubiquinol oxidase
LSLDPAPVDLKAEQKKTLEASRRPYGLLAGILPQIAAFVYYHVSWLLYVIDPKDSYELNADFEDHAEHEYMEFVRENPEFETRPFVSGFEKDYGAFASWADLFRRIGLDERLHKLESLARIESARFK